MVKVKICGLTAHEDAKLACDLGADMIGVIIKVDVSTPREVDFSQARKILGSVSRGVSTVAVSMPKGLEEAQELAGELDTDYLQIHFPLLQSELRRIRKEIGRDLIGVVSVPRNPEDPEEVISRAKGIAQVSDFLLLDTKGQAGGGTGKTHDWRTSLNIKEALDTPLILAGGLNPSNVRSAIEEVDPYGVDVASGVEREPGRKDPELVKSFIQNAGG